MENVKLCCEVCACRHNLDGCKCEKEGIKITTGSESNSAHYCADYEDQY